jgi:hypothetical protein
VTRFFDALLWGIVAFLLVLCVIAIYYDLTAPKCIMTEDDTILIRNEENGEVFRLWWNEEGWQFEELVEEEPSDVALFPVG